jgi:hypothetical protein
LPPGGGEECGGGEGLASGDGAPVRTTVSGADVLAVSDLPCGAADFGSEHAAMRNATRTNGTQRIRIATLLPRIRALPSLSGGIIGKAGRRA